MTKRFKKHFKNIYPLKKPKKEESLHTQKRNIILNIAQSDRISFSVLRNENNNLTCTN